MSMLQNAQYLRNAPLVNDTPPGSAQRSDQTIYVFVYNHYYDWNIFHRHFPMSNILGTARLGGWTWHINADGQPNIRRAYISPSTTIPPSQRLVWPSPITATSNSATLIPTPCTFGYIFSIPSTADKLIHRHFSPRNTRIRALFPVEVCISTSPRRVVRLNAITYFDPRLTSDLRRDIVLSRAQKKKWQVGLNLLRKTGAVPGEYTQRVAAKLNGNGEVEAVWVCPRGGGEERGMDLGFLAEDRVEDDVVIVDHIELTDSRRSPLNISVNQGQGPAPRLRLISGTTTTTNINSNSNSNSSRPSRQNLISSTRTQSSTTGNKSGTAATITVDSGSGSITQKGSPSPQKRARNPFAKTDGDGDGDDDGERDNNKPVKKYRRTSFGPAPRVKRRK